VNNDPELMRAYDEIRERIFATGVEGGPSDGAMVVVLFSRTSGEGVTTVAGGLAQSFGRSVSRKLGRSVSRKILLVGNEQGSLGPAKMLGVVPRILLRPETGYSSDAVLDSIQHVTESRVDILSLGGDHSPGDPSWESYFPKLRAESDVIVVDAGSMERDAPLQWCRWANQSLLVIDTSRAQVEALERLKADLKHSRFHLAGSILNKRRHAVPSYLYRWLS